MSPSRGAAPNSRCAACTPAAALPDDTPDEVKHARLTRLQAAVHGHGQAYAQRLLGGTQRVLVERHATRDRAEHAGRTECNRWVNFAGPAALIGRFAEVTIAEVRPYSLRGRLAAAPVARPAAAFA